MNSRSLKIEGAALMIYYGDKRCGDEELRQIASRGRKQSSVCSAIRERERERARRAKRRVECWTTCSHRIGTYFLSAIYIDSIAMALSLLLWWLLHTISITYSTITSLGLV